MTIPRSEEWVPVTDGEGSKDLLARYLRLHPLTYEELAEKAGLKSRDTASAVINGGGSPRSRTLVIKALEECEADAGLTGVPVPDPHDIVEFQVNGNFGVSVVVRGPVGDRAELEESVMRIIARMGGQGGQPGNGQDP